MRLHKHKFFAMFVHSCFCHLAPYGYHDAGTSAADTDSKSEELRQNPHMDLVSKGINIGRRWARGAVGVHLVQIG